jgi:hypothetical protein
MSTPRAKYKDWSPKKQKLAGSESPLLMRFKRSVGKQLVEAFFEGVAAHVVGVEACRAGVYEEDVAVGFQLRERAYGYGPSGEAATGDLSEIEHGGLTVVCGGNAAAGGQSTQRLCTDSKAVAFRIGV